MYFYRRPSDRDLRPRRYLNSITRVYELLRWVYDHTVNTERNERWNGIFFRENSDFSLRFPWTRESGDRSDRVNMHDFVTWRKRNFKKDTFAIKSPRDERTGRKFCWIKEIKRPRPISKPLIRDNLFLNSRSEMDVELNPVKTSKIARLKRVQRGAKQNSFSPL